METLQCCCPWASSSCPPIPGHVRPWGHPQNGFKRGQFHVGFSQGQCLQVFLGFPSTPPVLLSTHIREKGNNLAVKPSKASRIRDDGPRHAPSSKLTPSHSCCVPLIPKVPLGTEGWHYRDAVWCCEGRVSPAPLIPTEPLVLGKVLGQDLSWSAEEHESSRPPREGAFAGIFIPAGLFWFSPVVFKHRPSLRLSEPFACMKCPFSWDGGELGRNLSFPERVVVL